MRVLSFRDIFFFTVMDTVGRCYCYSICVIPPARGTVHIFPKVAFLQITMLWDYCTERIHTNIHPSWICC